jgi:transposase-like protein
VHGRRTYLCRAVGKHGLTIDLLLSERRDTAARRFFAQAVERHGAPGRITRDGYPATHAAVAELKASGVIRTETKTRTSKYLNNIIEQDHGRVKQRVYPMLGFKRFRNATITIKGTEPAQQIRKGSPIRLE